MEKTVKAYAKVNLSLYITGLREDGYHLISSVMQTINLHDLITVKKTSNGITVTSNNSNVPLGEENTVYKTAKLLKERFHMTGGYHIHIKKNIPIGAGLGGPSADAAATIKAINDIDGLMLESEVMEELGAQIGADVAFLVRGGLALCEGVGERIIPIDGSIPHDILLIKPAFSISTPWAYGEYDKRNIDSCKPKKIMVSALKKRDYTKIPELMYNDLEAGIYGRYPLIQKIKNDMVCHGADAGMMSGSGSTIFGLFSDERKLGDCADFFAENYEDLDVIPTKAVSREKVLWATI